MPRSAISCATRDSMNSDSRTMSSSVGTTPAWFAQMVMVSGSVLPMHFARSSGVRRLPSRSETSYVATSQRGSVSMRLPSMSQRIARTPATVAGVGGWCRVAVRPFGCRLGCGTCFATIRPRKCVAHHVSHD